MEPLHNWQFETVATASLFVIVFILRALPRLCRDPWLHTAFPLEGDTGDSMAHFAMVQEIQRNGGRIPGSAAQFEFARSLDYPMFFHWLVARLPSRFVERYEWTFTPFLDSIFAVVGFAVVSHFLPAVDAAGATDTNTLVVTAAAVATPIFLGPERRPALGERAFGLLVSTAYFACMAVYLEEESAFWAAGAIGALAVVFTSSKFSIQAVVFISAIMSAVLASYIPLAFLAAGFASATLLSRGYAIRVLSGQIRHSVFYYREQMHYHDYVRQITNATLIEAFFLLARGRPFAAWTKISGHPYGRILARFPWLVPFVVATVTVDKSGLGIQIMFAWAWAGIFVAFLTGLERFKFLGEAFRYLEYSLVPTVVCVASIPAAWGGELWLAVSLPGFVWTFYRLVRRNAFDYPSANAKEAIRFVAGLAPSKIFAIPGRLCFPLCYRTAHRGYWVLGNIDVPDSNRRWAALFSRSGLYPYPDPDILPSLHEKTNCDLLVIWKLAAREAERVTGKKYEFSRFDVLFENPDFVVCRIVAPTEGPGVQ